MMDHRAIIIIMIISTLYGTEYDYELTEIAIDCLRACILMMNIR